METTTLPAEAKAAQESALRSQAAIDKDKAARYELWKFFSDEHGLSLTETDVNDIIAAVETYQQAVKGL